MCCELTSLDTKAFQGTSNKPCLVALVPVPQMHIVVGTPCQLALGMISA